MNFHFLVDDKFTDDYIKNVLAISQDNTFYFICDKSPKKIKYPDGILTQYNDELLKNVLDQLKPGDSCIFHWLSPEAGWFVSRLPNNVKKCLLLMGGDVFEFPSSVHKTYAYDPVSLDYFEKKVKGLAFNKWYAYPFQIAKSLFVDFIKPLYDKSRYLKKIDGIRSFDFIGHWNRFDVELLRTRDGMTARHLPYYFDVGLHDDLPPENCDDKNFNIWIGNSATLSNNHLDLFEKLKNTKLPEGYKLFVPLSYGDTDLAAYIEQKGKEYFGDHFVPVKGYLPRSEYYELLNSCNYFIMYHNRMQAAGNIFALMKMGKKLFLKGDATTYKEYKIMGANIYTIEDLLSEPLKFLEPLNSEQKIRNREVVNLIANEATKSSTLRFILNAE